MVAIINLVAGMTVAASVASGSAIKPIQKRLAHDAVVEFPETVPDTLQGELFLRYKPFLEVVNGCLPFPAFDKDGNINDGLDKCDGDESNECDFGKGQVYARGRETDDKYAIMYSWYMPKDVPVVCSGHRHDWENIVLWFSSKSHDADYLGIAISAHGGYQKYPQGSDEAGWDGDRPLIAYSSEGLNHHLGATFKKGGDQPLLAYDSIPDVAWDAVNGFNFESANFPFGTEHFDSLIADSMP